MLQTDRDAQQVAGSPGLRAFYRGTMFDQTMRTAQAGRAYQQPAPRRDAHGSLFAAAHLKREHAAKGRHLPGYNLVAWMAVEPRIVDRLHRGMRMQPSRHLHGV